MRTIESAIDEYIEEYGVRPEPAILSRLADEILREELSDKNEHKILQNELPIMSYRQIERRQNNEASYKFAENIGSDGKNYQKPLRNFKYL